MKKKFDFKKLLFFGGIPTAILSVVGFIVISSKTVTSYAELPKRVEKIETYVDAQQRSNEIQQEANNLMRQMIQQQVQPEIIYSPDRKSYFDQESGKWKSVKEFERGR